MAHENCFLRAFGTNLLQEWLQELVAEAPPDSEGFKGSRCPSLPSLPAPAALLAGELGVMHGWGIGCLQWWTGDAVCAVCCTGNTGNVPHPQLTERSFLFYCVTTLCLEHPFCSLLNPALLCKSLACLDPTNWKSISQAMCYNFTPLLNELFWICGKLFTQEALKEFPFLIVLLGWVAQDLYFFLQKFWKGG